MVTDIWLFSIFLLITGALIFILVFFIITLSGESISHTYWQVAQPCFIQIWSATTWTPKNAAAVWTSGTSRSCGCSWWSWRCCWCPATGASSSSTSPSAPGSSESSTGCLGAISVRCLFSIQLAIYFHALYWEASTRVTCSYSWWDQIIKTLHTTQHHISRTVFDTWHSLS